jgi:hypothetical protein
MAVLVPADIQSALNIDLTAPNGQTLATSLIAAAVAYVENALGFPLESITQTKYFNGEFNHFWLPTGAPVTNLVMATHNSTTQSYDPIDAQYIRTSGNEVFISLSLPHGFQTVRATYTNGWSAATLPADLKQALIDLVGLKLQEVTNYSSNPDDPTGAGTSPDTGALKKVTSGSYTEEYASSGAEAAWKAKTAQLSRTIGDAPPAGVQEVVRRYRPPIAL